MQTTPHLLDVVALLSDTPDHHLVRGHVGSRRDVVDWSR